MCQEVFSEGSRHILKQGVETLGIFSEVRYVELQWNNGL